MKSAMLWSDRSIKRFSLTCSTALKERGIDRLHCSMGKRCKECRQQKFNYRQLCIGGKIKPAKLAAKAKKPALETRIVNVRGTRVVGEREFAVQTDREMIWIAEHKLPVEVVLKWCSEIDKPRKKRYVQTSLERLAHKDRCNTMHCELIRRLIKRNPGYRKQAHIVLIDPSEGARSAKALLDLGINKSDIYAPNPNVYAACCSLGFPNVKRCKVSELAGKLARPVASAQLDFTGSFDGPIKRELTEFFQQINMTDYFVFSLNVSRSRQTKPENPTQGWRCQLLPFIDNLLDARGYKFHDLVKSHLMHDYASSESSMRMYYHSWIICKK